MKRGLIIAGLFSLLLSDCQARSVYLKPPLEEEGEVFIYLQPFPQEAERLRFRIQGISAVSEDQREFPASILLPELKGSEMRRQRLLASVRLPPGPYIGLSLKVQDALLRIEEGDVNLKAPDEPVRTEFRFNVSRKRATVISLALKYSESIREGISFIPAFTLFVPEKPIAGLTGYVANEGSNNITVFNKKSGQVTGVIATGKGPRGIALDQRLRRAYVALSGEDAIEIIDITAGEVIDRIRLNTGDHPQELALTPDGRALLTVNTGSNTVSIIDTGSRIVLNRIGVGDGPNSLVMDKAGRRAYIFNTLSNSISVIDIPTNSIAATISTETGPLRGQLNRAGDRLYVIYSGSPYLTVIDPFSLTVLRREFVGMRVSSIKVDTLRDMIYVGRSHDILVEVYDPFSFVPGDFIKASGGVSFMTIDGDENNLCLIVPERKSLVIINLISRKVLSELDVGEAPYWAALMGER